jgi:trk system potassium uptake protein TrkA
MIDAPKFVIIAGCGRFGSYLANTLSKTGTSVVIVDNNPEAFSHLAEEFSGFKVEGEITEIALLRRIKLEKAEVFIAATREDNVNLMVTQIAREIFGVREVYARVNDPNRREVFEDMGVMTICPLVVAGDSLLKEIGVKVDW